MICSKCGARYPDDRDACPFCGGENLRVAVKRQRQEVAGAYEKIAALEQRPHRAVKKARRFLWWAAAAAAALFLAALVFTLVLTGVWSSGALGRQERQLARLEEYYAAGQYEKMGRYLDKIPNSYEAVFEKYSGTERLYRSMDLARDALSSTAEYLSRVTPGAITAEDAERDLTWAFEVLWEAEEHRAAGYPCGEEAAVEEIRAEMERCLREYARLTDDEIRSGTERGAAEEGPSLADLAEAFLERALEG